MFYNSAIPSEDKSNLPSLVMYFNETNLDIYSLAVNSSCTLYIDKTFDRSEYFITPTTNVNTKLIK